MNILDFNLTPLQQEAIDFGLSRRSCAFFLPPRAGKTIIACRLVESGMKVTKQPFQGLLVCLLANKESTWSRHLGMISGLTVATSIDEYLATPKDRPRLLLVHYDALHTEDWYRIELMQFHWTGLDEAHKMNSKKSRSAAILKNVRSLRRYLFTGSPSHTDPEDLYNQMDYIQPGILGKPSQFKKNYMRQDRYHQWRMREEAIPSFFRTIEPVVFQRGYGSIGLHKPQIQVVPYSLLPEQKRLYSQMRKDDLVTVAGGHTIMGGNAIVKAIRLRQILNGFLPLNKKTNIQFDTGKTQVLKDLLTNQPRPAIVFYQYEEELSRVESAVRSLGLTYGVVSGGTKKGSRMGIIDSLRKGVSQVLIMQVTIGGVGLDIPEAKTVIMYSAPNSAIYFSQAINRNNFIGLALPPIVHYLSSGLRTDKLPLNNLEEHYALWDRSIN